MYKNKVGTTTFIDNLTWKKFIIGSAAIYLSYRATKTAIK